MANTRIAIARDGTIQITDLWDRMNLVSPATKQVTLKTSNDPHGIGILDYGLLHGEEPEVSGASGTGAIYVHGCPLRCKTCYQPEFFSDQAPLSASPESLSELMLDLENAGAHSISIVIATFNRQILKALQTAHAQGLQIPVVYKYSGLLNPQQVELLRDVVDIFLPDLKAVTPELAQLHGLPGGYTQAALHGIRHVMTSTPRTIVRHLLVPHFPAALHEVACLMKLLPFAETRTPLSLLTHYYDVDRKELKRFPEEKIQQIEALAEEAHVPLLIPGRGSYVPYSA